MKNEQYIEIDSQLIIKVLGVVAIFAYLIYFFGQYDQKRDRQAMEKVFQNIQLEEKSHPIHQALNEIQEPDGESFRKVNQLAEQLVGTASIEEYHVYQNMLIKRDGEFYNLMYQGYSCEGELRPGLLQDGDEQQIKKLLKTGENTLDNGLLFDQENEYSSRIGNVIYYVLDFDPERTTVLKVFVND